MYVVHVYCVFVCLSQCENVWCRCVFSFSYTRVCDTHIHTYTHPYIQTTWVTAHARVCMNCGTCTHVLPYMHVVYVYCVWCICVNAHVCVCMNHGTCTHVSLSVHVVCVYCVYACLCQCVYMRYRYAYTRKHKHTFVTHIYTRTHIHTNKTICAATQTVYINVQVCDIDTQIHRYIHTYKYTYIL